jgi:hypothetical protein
MRRPASAIALSPVNAIECLAQAQTQEVVLGPVQQPAKALVCRHNLAALIKDDSGRRKGAQQSLQVRNCREVFVFGLDLFDRFPSCGI